MRRPKCPRCGGTAVIDGQVFEVFPDQPGLAWHRNPDRPCPECMEDPGLASWDRIMAIANGVINDVDEHGTGTWQSVREYLIHCELSKR